jgi:hypothetical protein
MLDVLRVSDEIIANREILCGLFRRILVWKSTGRGESQPGADTVCSAASRFIHSRNRKSEAYRLPIVYLEYWRRLRSERRRVLRAILPNRRPKRALAVHEDEAIGFPEQPVGDTISYIESSWTGVELPVRLGNVGPTVTMK